MRRAALLAGAALAFTSTLALAAPESLLPPVFDEPAPAPTPAPAARPAPAPAPAPSARPAAPSGVSSPVVQPLPTPREGGAAASVTPGARTTLVPGNFPSLSELEAMSPDELDELFGLKPEFDIPPGARRALRQVGVIDAAEGGFAAGLLAGQPGELVRAAIEGTRGPLVSRWGHILLRRALASRLDAPVGMDPAAFAAMRASLLNRMGEAHAARALAQDVDSANYTPALASAAFDAYIGTGDILGICPVMQVKGDLVDSPQWQMSQAICNAYEGNGRQAEDSLRRALNRGIAPRIDVLLAQRFAGAAGEGRRAVTIEWEDVEELTPWRLSFSRALGVEIPEPLRERAEPPFDFIDVAIPAVPLMERIAAAEEAATAGVLSSSAMVDLYSQLWADPAIDDSDKERAGTLRRAYVARDLGARLEALRTLWGEQGGEGAYASQVLTAYAAARLPLSETLVDDAPRIVGSMLAAGLDRNALRWGSLVPEGSAAWGLLALAQPGRDAQVSGGAINDYIAQDDSAEQRKSQFLVAGLAGLGRLDVGSASEYASELGTSLTRQSAWTRKIDRAAQLGNPVLVALLAGVGMQGDGWDEMTARQLFHIVRALTQVGLQAEARMIAAEAVARG